jgi:hypothetical protein
MKNKLPSFSHYRTHARALLLGIGLLVAGLASAQNFVKNPDFEDPLGPDNWTVGYAAVFGGGSNQPTNCGPFDFLFAGRSTMAHKDMVPGTWDGEDRTGTNYWSKFGGIFAPNHTWMMHGYFKQIVKGLTPGAYYDVSAWMAFFSGNDAYLAKCNIYLEAIGLLGSKTTPYPAANVTNVNNNPAGWWRYAVTNRATSAGEIEVRLHFNKFGTTSTWEYRNFNALYDHVAVVPTGQSEYLPAYKILSCTRSNLDLTLTWQSVMNNRYRIQYTRDLFNPASWSFVQWSPKLDTNLYASGTNYTFTTNLACLFSYDPSVDLTKPLFFRIYSRGYQP